MICVECGGTLQEKHDLLEVNDPYVGTITIEGVPYFQCDKCDNVFYTQEMSHAIETERNNRIRKSLLQLPLESFVNASEATSILGISRQALHKNRRINHGFIYNLQFAGIKLYHKESTLMYKEQGDGRFPLHLTLLYSKPEFVIQENQYVYSLVGSKPAEFKNYSISTKEPSYGK